MTDAQELLNIVGKDLMGEICGRFGGDRIYIPQHVPDPQRNEKIINAFTTELQKPGTTTMSSYERAADIYGLSRRHVQNIIAHTTYKI